MEYKYEKLQNDRPKGTSKRILGLLATFCAALLVYSTPSAPASRYDPNCTQEEAFEPTINKEVLNDRYLNFLTSFEYKSELVKRFGQALRFPTVSYDNMRGNGQGAKDAHLHKPFVDYRNYLAGAYPLVHSKLNQTIINDYSLLYQWGSLATKEKPILLMAHMDVVPVDPLTVGDWTYPPFAGHFDGKRMWGRGSVDVKLLVTSILEAVEALLQVDFVPTRPILIAFGHDEEISGYNGARNVFKYLENNLGIKQNGIELVLDEGPNIVGAQSVELQSLEPKIPSFAMLGLSEKGYIDLNITVTMKNGGHASVPPPHTGIGIISEVITTIENNPPAPDINGNNPLLGSLSCVAAHTSLLSARQKFMLSHFDQFKPLILNEMRQYAPLAPFITTTQAVDVIQGGIKVNALPTSVIALVNMRLAPHESVAGVVERLGKLIAPIAEKHNMDYEYGLERRSINDLGDDAQGSIILSFADAIEPSPITSTEKFAYKRLSAVIRRVFDVVVTPVMMTANTDTRWSWNVGESVIRFMAAAGDLTGIHTVNENVPIDSVVNSVRFYHELIRAFNE